MDICLIGSVHDRTGHDRTVVDAAGIERRLDQGFAREEGISLRECAISSRCWSGNIWVSRSEDSNSTSPMRTSVGTRSLCRTGSSPSARVRTWRSG